MAKKELKSKKPAKASPKKEANKSAQKAVKKASDKTGKVAKKITKKTGVKTASAKSPAKLPKKAAKVKVVKEKTAKVKTSTKATKAKAPAKTAAKGKSLTKASNAKGAKSAKADKAKVKSKAAAGKEKSQAKTAPGKTKSVSLSKAKVQESSDSREEKSPKSKKAVSFLEMIRDAMRSSSSIRMFKNPLIEKFSHVHPLTPIFIYVPVIFLSMYFYFFKENAGFFAFLIFYSAGAFLWTIIEYTLHRFLFHPPFSESHLKWFYFYVHGVHHEVPTDATRLVMPPGASIPLAIIFFFIFRALLPNDYLALYSGFVSGYLVYDFLHFATHFFSFDQEWFKNLKKHHNVHHFNAPEKNFGVSNSLWDYVFSTKYRSH